MSIFTDVFVKPPKRSKQVLDHDLITTTDFGKIIPILLEDVVPGDIFKCKSAAEIKLFPTLAPLRQGIEVRIDYFFVPNRLIWDDWETFITGGPDGTELPVAPYMEMDNNLDDSLLGDYFGLPCLGLTRDGVGLYPQSLNVSALPFRAYAMIWNEYYRDQNLQDETDLVKTSGLDTDTNTFLLYRGLKKDYFTSALPWTQRGPQVSIPLSGEAPLKGGFDTSGNSDYKDADTGRVVSPSSFGTQVTNGDLEQNSSTGYKRIIHSHSVELENEEVYADLSEASAVTINELRRLNSVQKWLERNARAGSRYVEQILSHFGVRTPDYRLDRPEYLGGQKQILGMAEILQTSETSATPQGTRSGVGYGNMLSGCRRYHVTEHGWIMGLMSIIPQHNVYADGVQRKWTRESKFDYYFPEFQNLGEQAIKNKEIFGYDRNGQTENPEGTFGYTPRYAEYRYHPSIVTGQMRHNMSYWHMARLFNQEPSLNDSFVNSLYSVSSYSRMFPTDEELGDRFVVYMKHFERMKRPMQKNPIPSL